MRQLKLFLATLTVGIALLGFVAAPAFAAVDPLQGACSNANAKLTSSACQGSNGNNPLVGEAGLLTKASRIIAYIAGIAAVILMIIGGLMYVLSDGDAGKVSSAKNTILYAAVGLVIVVIAQAIVLFVINAIYT